MKALRVLLALVVALVASLAVALPVYADQANPDEPPTVIQFDVYHNLLETNDYLLLIYENTPYATTPNATATDAFYWRLFDDNNTTEYGWSTPYAFHDKGYGYNLVSLYFDNTTAPAWGEECYVRLDGNPAVFTTPPAYQFQVEAGDYTSENATALVQEALRQRILFLASDLAARWEVAATSFLYESEAESYLSAAGQAFFRGAIYGLQGLCPELFPYNVGAITITDRNWTLTYSNSLASQWAGTWVESAQNAGKEFWSLDYDLLSIMLVLVLGAALLIGNIMLSSDTWAGLMDVGILMIATARLGLYPLAFLALMAALGIVYISLKIWGLGR